MSSDLKLFLEPQEHFAIDFFKQHVPCEQVALEDCDYVISGGFSLGLKKKSELQAILNRYAKYSKKVIAFLISDFDGELQVPKNVLLFRTSMYRTKKKPNEMLLPYIWEGFDEPFEALPKTDKPIVGFCGSIKNDLGKRLSCVKAFEKNKEVASNFILREAFWGGKPHDACVKNDFLRNIEESHFVISNRGVGNFSMRFYQVLSLGRIPVLLDTDMVFPFEDEIHWKDYIVLGKDENELLVNVLDFWNAKTESEIEQLQADCKILYESYFKPEAFGVKMKSLLEEYLVKDFPFKSRRYVFKRWFRL